MVITEITPKKAQEQRILRLAAYCRVSSDSDDQRHSFLAQIRHYKEYEQQNPQYRLVDIYADEGITGTSMKLRDEMNRMIRDCQQGKIDRIITKSVSRFARNTEDLLETLRLLKKLNVSVYFEEQGIDSAKLNMEMIVTFPGMVAQKESESISGNLRWSYQKRMQSGEFVGCRSPYGYKLENGELIVKEDEAEVVRRVFQLYLSGMGKQAIVNTLNEEGAPCRYGTKRWGFATVCYILTNERYIGDVLMQKAYTTDTLPFKLCRNHGEKPQYYVEDRVPPIISKETWLAAQALSERRSVVNRSYKTYPLSAMLYCKDCGHPYRRQWINEKAYWICNYRACGRGGCQLCRVQEEAVYDTFTLMLDKLTESRADLLQPLIRQMEQIEHCGTETDQIHAIDQQIANISAQNLVLARLHTKGILNDADFTAQSDELTHRLTQLRAQRRKELTRETEDDTLEALHTLDDLLAQNELPTRFSEEQLDQVVERITVLDNATLRFHLRCGLTLTETIPERKRCGA